MRICLRTAWLVPQRGLVFFMAFRGVKFFDIAERNIVRFSDVQLTFSVYLPMNKTWSGLLLMIRNIVDPLQRRGSTCCASLTRVCQSYVATPASQACEETLFSLCKKKNMHCMKIFKQHSNLLASMSGACLRLPSQHSPHCPQGKNSSSHRRHIFFFKKKKHTQNTTKARRPSTPRGNSHRTTKSPEWLKDTQWTFKLCFRLQSRTRPVLLLFRASSRADTRLCTCFFPHRLPHCHTALSLSPTTLIMVFLSGRLCLISLPQGLGLATGAWLTQVDTCSTSSPLPLRSLTNCMLAFVHGRWFPSTVSHR